jgi:hypothetical protein
MVRMLDPLPSIRDCERSNVMLLPFPAWVTLMMRGVVALAMYKVTVPVSLSVLLWLRDKYDGYTLTTHGGKGVGVGVGVEPAGGVGVGVGVGVGIGVGVGVECGFPFGFVLPLPFPFPFPFGVGVGVGVGESAGGGSAGGGVAVGVGVASGMTSPVTDAMSTAGIRSSGKC